MKKNNEVMSSIMLSSAKIENITQKLQKLVAADSNVSELAYASNVNFSEKCSCKDGCTSW